ncbi:hypothetical protein AB1Y20_009826 [Prymnesium parvum]|uniref:ADP,ATP carrier protein n=1 Tax=Prymnesium parvum TaxID=97485 RepID=A0AB34K1Z8_PRYPA
MVVSIPLSLLLLPCVLATPHTVKLHPHWPSHAPRPPTLSRRAASVAGVVGALSLLPLPTRAATSTIYEESTKLVWEPRGKLPPRVPSSYKPFFITYLARFLLNYDSGSALWWDRQARALPVDMTREELRTARRAQFGQFAESVEVGLLRYQGKEGVRQLFSLLRSRYGVSREGKLQLALLFSLISAANQPSDLIRRALGEADNATLCEATVVRPGGGYILGRPPAVEVSPPDAGAAPPRVRAVLAPSGRVLRVDLTSPGAGYIVEPAVTVAPPSRGGRAAQAKAVVVSGRVAQLLLLDPGEGYADRDQALVEVEPPRDESGQLLFDGVKAEAIALLDSYVSSIAFDSCVSGYSRDQPVSLSIAPPPASADASPASAAASPSHAYPLKPSATPYAPLGAVSQELLELLPLTQRPDRSENGTFSLELATLAAFQSRQAVALGAPRGAPRRRSTNPFGILGNAPVEREVRLTRDDYFRFAASGAVCTAVVRSALAPIDVVKTLMQAAPHAYPSLGEGLRSLYRGGGVRGLFLGVDVTLAAALLLGGCGFGVNEFLRRYLSDLLGAQAQLRYGVQISVGAALGAVLFSALVTCPFEVLRLRAINAAVAAAVEEEAEEGEEQEKRGEGGGGEGGEAGEMRKVGVESEALGEGERGGEGGGVAGVPATRGDGDRAAPHGAAPGGAEWLQGVLGGSGAVVGVEKYSLYRGLGTLWEEGGVKSLYASLFPLLLRELPFQACERPFPSATPLLCAPPKPC